MNRTTKHRWLRLTSVALMSLVLAIVCISCSRTTPVSERVEPSVTPGIEPTIAIYPTSILTPTPIIRPASQGDHYRSAIEVLSETPATFTETLTSQMLQSISQAVPDEFEFLYFRDCVSTGDIYEIDIVEDSLNPDWKENYVQINDSESYRVFISAPPMPDQETMSNDESGEVYINWLMARQIHYENLETGEVFWVRTDLDLLYPVSFFWVAEDMFVFVEDGPLGKGLLTAIDVQERKFLCTLWWEYWFDHDN